MMCWCLINTPSGPCRTGAVCRMGGSWPADRSRCAQPSQVGFRLRRPPDPGTCGVYVCICCNFFYFGVCETSRFTGKLFAVVDRFNDTFSHATGTPHTVWVCRRVHGQNTISDVQYDTLPPACLVKMKIYFSTFSMTHKKVDELML